MKKSLETSLEECLSSLSLELQETNETIERPMMDNTGEESLETRVEEGISRLSLDNPSQKTCNTMGGNVPTSNTNKDFLETTESTKLGGRRLDNVKKVLDFTFVEPQREVCLLI